MDLTGWLSQPAAQVLALQSHRGELLVHLLVALALTWSIGFERELRGSAAGDRTFSLVGLGSAVIGYLALDHAPNALAGVVTGIGFIGAGVIIHGSNPSQAPDGTDDDPPGLGDEDMRMVRGVTTAATIYLAAAVGAACGQGQLLLALLATGFSLFLLEVRHVRALRWIDGRHWRKRFHDADAEAEDQLDG
ncbi:MgtC/SapB family protein [Aquihabitans sp. G128]|uniref:MgtC/SapB family protein n=1 Tax=Aquihabitans sp. G128 TaxID=2849779 RepID=UPI0020B3DEC1|nr:MgtC/SapB family protein [Aquihabitans sp. G128]